MENFEFSKKCGDEKMLINKYEDAINRYNLCLEIDSDKNHLVLLNRCLAYLYLDKYDEALNDAKESIKLKSDNPKAWSRLGSCLLALNKQEDARIAFLKAYELNPSNNDYKRLSLEQVNEEINEEVNEVKVNDKQEEINEVKVNDKQEEINEVKVNDKQEEINEIKVNDKQEEVEVIDLEEDKELEELIKNLTTVKKKNEIPREFEKMIPKNGLMGTIFSKMMNNKNLLEMLDDTEFQNKINNYHLNPMEAMKDPQMINIMNNIMNDIQLK